MAIYRYGGTILRRSGGLAKSANCCCDEEPICCLPQLYMTLVIEYSAPPFEDFEGEQVTNVVLNPNVPPTGVQTQCEYNGGGTAGGGHTISGHVEWLTGGEVLISPTIEATVLGVTEPIPDFDAPCPDSYDSGVLAIAGNEGGTTGWLRITSFEQEE